MKGFVCSVKGERYGGVWSREKLGCDQGKGGGEKRKYSVCTNVYMFVIDWQFVN